MDGGTLPTLTTRRLERTGVASAGAQDGAAELDFGAERLTFKPLTSRKGAIGFDGGYGTCAARPRAQATSQIPVGNHKCER
jgi:hypothetical protein